MVSVVVASSKNLFLPSFWSVLAANMQYKLFLLMNMPKVKTDQNVNTFCESHNGRTDPSLVCRYRAVAEIK